MPSYLNALMNTLRRSSWQSILVSNSEFINPQMPKDTTHQLIPTILVPLISAFSQAKMKHICQQILKPSVSETWYNINCTTVNLSSANISTCLPNTLIDNRIILIFERVWLSFIWTICQLAVSI